MKTIIKFPEGLVEAQYNSTLVSFLVSIIVTGITLIISYNMINFEDNATISTLIISGIFLTIIMAIALSFSLKQMVLASSGSPLVCRTIEFKESAYNEVRLAVMENRWEDIKRISLGTVGVSMKIELVYTRDKNFAAYQFFKYIPHSYEPYGDIAYISSKGYASTTTHSYI